MNQVPWRRTSLLLPTGVLSGNLLTSGANLSITLAPSGKVLSAGTEWIRAPRFWLGPFSVKPAPADKENRL